MRESSTSLVGNWIREDNKELQTLWMVVHALLPSLNNLNAWERRETMRLFEKQKQTKTPMQVFNEMMVGISEIIELYDSQLIKDNPNGNEVIYNYVMKNENGLVKIGISHDVEFRKRTLENAGGYYIPYVYKTISKIRAFDVESMLHDYFSLDRKLGEWFEINYDEAVKKLLNFLN